MSLHRFFLLLVSLGIGGGIALTPAFSKSANDASPKEKKELKGVKKKSAAGSVSEEDLAAARELVTRMKDSFTLSMKPELRPALQVAAREALTAQGFSEENMLSPVELAYYTYVGDSYAVTLRLLAGADANALLPWSETEHYWFNSHLEGVPPVALLPDMILPDSRTLLAYCCYGHVDLSTKLKNGQTLREYFEGHPEQQNAAAVLKNLSEAADSQTDSTKKESHAKAHGKKKGTTAGPAANKKKGKTKGKKMSNSQMEESSALDVPGFAASPDALCHPSKAMRQEAYDFLNAKSENILNGSMMYNYAVANSPIRLNKYLLAGANPNMVSEDKIYSGMTPLMASLLGADGNPHIGAIFVILHGGDVNQLAFPYLGTNDNKKTTPLHRICEGGDNMVLRHLLFILNPRHAPDFTRKDDYGETPIQHAYRFRSQNKEAVFKILREAGIDTEEKSDKNSAAE